MDASIAGASPEKGKSDIPEDSVSKSGSSTLISMSAASPATKHELAELSENKTAKHWTPEINDAFIRAVLSLGHQNATPNGILQLMNVKGLTMESVTSHLLSYRLSLQKTQDFAFQEPGSGDGTSSAHQLFDEIPQGLAGGGISAAHQVFDDMHLKTSNEGSAGGGISGAYQPFDEIPPHSAGVGASGTHLVFGEFCNGKLLGEKMKSGTSLNNILQNESPKDAVSESLATFVEKRKTKKSPIHHHHHMKSLLNASAVFAPTYNYLPIPIYYPTLSAIDHRPFKSITHGLTPYHSIAKDVKYPGSMTYIPIDPYSHLQPSLPFDRMSINDPLHFDTMIVNDALLYCALFPPGDEFEKDTLVQLWMADGIFVEEPMERIAGLFFEDCLTKNYFQLSRTNLVTGKAMYKFIRDSRLDTLLISRDKRIGRIEGSYNLNDLSPEVSHVSIRCHNLKDFTAFCGFKKLEQLRTLILIQGQELSFKQVSRSFFLSLRLLRVLDLSQTRLMELPSSIENLVCLCYLDLSGTPIKCLPESIDCLKMIQTLKLRSCWNLSTLPNGMRKLINLRHLDFDVLHQLRSMPQGMGALTSIRTLSAFLVGVEEGCSIRQLKSMNNISGSFCISRLENVLTTGEAEEACLSNKSELTKLELHWSDSQDEDVVGNDNIISSLQPNTSLEELRISCYGGFELPHWICNPAYSKLVSITLFKCENCLVLSSLGQLPSLKSLNIADFRKLKVIDQKFYRGAGIPGCIAFPKLERLTVENMFSFEEWSGLGRFNFPHLLKLTIKHCPKLQRLRALSSLSSLEHLEISGCEMLSSFPNGKLPDGLETFIVEDCPFISAMALNDGGQDWYKVAHIPHVWIDHQEMSKNLREI
ncbi:putative disease resistance RPP13-like protein 1 isoform X2 [Spinacia oleracea]|uniref:Disease resistance RPP13-like protein 1 isoform X2 n=1 Tax=Spinacia oleracea TaxID=3562 RepID=A0A9R0JK72_SPIOL|nr:putative disease resistance RPP13-like protein 1 isoform X2 [Spinacia oleracea]